MKFIWNNKFIFWNFVALIIIKAVFAYSGFQLATLFQGVPVFPKEEVISQTNSFRSSLGLTGLKENQTLSLAASQKLQDMINNQYFAHYSPSGTSPWYWLETNKYNYRVAGENLAIGFLSAKNTVDAWVQSPSHRQNLANPSYREIGVAVAPAKIQDAEGILVVQLFGTPSPARLVALTPTKTIKPTPPPPKAAAIVKPSPTVSPSPSPTTKPDAATTGQGRFHVASSPKTLSISATPNQITKTVKTLNSVFIIYALLLFLVSVALITLRQPSREFVFRTALVFVLAVLAFSIPVIQVTQVALIF